MLKEDGFLDTPEQLADYWNKVPGGNATFLNIKWDDTEQDVQTITDIKKCYDFYFSRTPQHLYMRRWPCVCPSCMDVNFGTCTESAGVGEWDFRETVPTVINHPKGLSAPVVSTPTEENSTEYFEVEKIVAKRLVKNQVHYLIKWLGWATEHNEWKSLDELQCQDLIDEFEQSHKNKILPPFILYSKINLLYKNGFTLQPETCGACHIINFPLCI